MNDATAPVETQVSEAQASGAPSRASGSSFYTAMRILPRAQREAMFEIYSYCRLVDDIADSSAPHAERRKQLAQWRSRIDALYSGNPPAELRALAKVSREFSLRKEDFQAVIDGMEMDAAEDIRAPDWATLELYCDRVASAVGRLSVRVFGMNEPDGIALAHHLGRALQLTNILRDLDEDAEIGRLYLPQEALREAGITSTDPKIALASPALAQVCDAVAARARGHFQESDTIMARNPRRAVKAPRIMEEVYRVMLDGMAARGWVPPRRRVQVSGLRLSWIALQYAFI
jgi:squalene synthase HpnD